MFTNGPKQPHQMLRVERPEIALFIEPDSSDPDWSVVVVDGKKWSIKTKNIRHLRRNNVSEINRSL